MKTEFDKMFVTVDATETPAIRIPVESPAMYFIEALVLLSFGDEPRYGGSIRIKGTFVVDADFHARFVGAPAHEQVLLSETLRGLATNLQVPRIWFGVIDPIDEQEPSICISVQGPPAISVGWRVVGTAQSLTN